MFKFCINQKCKGSFNSNMLLIKCKRNILSYGIKLYVLCLFRRLKYDFSFPVKTCFTRFWYTVFQRKVIHSHNFSKAFDGLHCDKYLARKRCIVDKNMITNVAHSVDWLMKNLVAATAGRYWWHWMTNWNCSLKVRVFEIPTFILSR